MISSPINKCISLSLFGFGQEEKDCHSFKSFMQFFSVNLRAYKFLFPDYDIVLYIDADSYKSHILYFGEIHQLDFVRIWVIAEKEDLCKSMLWRLYPVFSYDYTICRDIDSLPTLKDWRCVEKWIQDGTKAHAISDSISHTIPLMGGMIGFTKYAFPKYILENPNFDFKRKGSDQDFLNKFVLPYVSHSLSEFRFLGISPMPNNSFAHDTSSGEFSTTLTCDLLVNHIGQGGYHLEETFNEITNRKYEGALNYYVRNPQVELLGKEVCELNQKLLEAEKLYPETFYWTL
jgi:hypothetical protein